MSKNKEVFASEDVLNYLSVRPLGELMLREVSFEDVDAMILAERKAKNDVLIEDKAAGEFERVVERFIVETNKMFDEIHLFINRGALIDSRQFPSEKIFLAYLDACCKQAIAEVKETESERMLKSDILEKAPKEIEEITAEIAKIEANLSELKLRAEKKILPLETEIEEIEKKISDIENEIREEDENLKLKTALRLKKKSKAHHAHIRALAAHVKELEAHYQSLGEENQNIERRNIEQKLKAEQSLQMILLKFDNDVGSRAVEADAIEGEIDAESKKFELWKSTIFVQQEAEYTKLMEEVEEEEARERAEKLEQIRREHAARVIQAAWKKRQMRRKRMQTRKKTTKSGKK